MYIDQFTYIFPYAFISSLNLENKKNLIRNPAREKHKEISHTYLSVKHQHRKLMTVTAAVVVVI